MKLISPTNREVDIGQTLLPNEYIGMTRREVLDTYLRDRAISFGAKAVNAIEFTRADTNSKEKMEFDYVIGADGANSRVAKAIGTYKYIYLLTY
jgi:geranylgeranyl reductase